MLPDKLTKSDIVKAIDSINESDVPQRRNSTKFDILYNGKRYPPKYVISLANKIKTGSLWASNLFSGGRETNEYLIDRGFIVVTKGGQKIGKFAQDEDESLAYFEGRKRYKAHVSYERNKGLVDKKKNTELNTTGVLKCEACGFDFNRVYGNLGYGFIECHHNRPVSSFSGIHLVKLEELSLLCSNCHRMVHRSRPWISVQELKNKIRMA